MLAVAESWTTLTSEPLCTLSYSVVCCNTYSWEQVDFRLPTHCCDIFKSRLRNKSTSFDLAGKSVKKELLFPYFYFVCPSSTPSRSKLCSQKFHNTFWSNSRLEDSFWGFLKILADRLRQIALTESQKHRSSVITKMRGPTNIKQNFILRAESSANICAVF